MNILCTFCLLALLLMVYFFMNRGTTVVPCSCASSGWAAACMWKLSGFLQLLDLSCFIIFEHNTHTLDSVSNLQSKAHTFQNDMKPFLLASYEVILRVVSFVPFIQKQLWFYWLWICINKSLSLKVPKCCKMTNLPKTCSGFCNFSVRGTMEVRPYIFMILYSVFMSVTDNGQHCTRFPELPENTDW